jgi:hypothetical protein
MIHNGFNDSAYAYCDRDGTTALLDAYASRPAGVRFEPFKRIANDVEPFLRPCNCGGRFTASASPRCPKCRHELSATDAAAWIEGSAKGTDVGWRWQRSWDALYCIVISGRSAANPWV